MTTDQFEHAISPLRLEFLESARSRLDRWLRERAEALLAARFRSLWDAWTPLAPDQREELVAEAIGALADGAPHAELKFDQLKRLPE